MRQMAYSTALTTLHLPAANQALHQHLRYRERRSRMPLEAKMACHAIELGERDGQVSLDGVEMLAFVPLAHVVACCDGAILPAHVAVVLVLVTKPLLGDIRGVARPRARLLLFGVERPPFGLLNHVSQRRGRTGGTLLPRSTSR